MYAILLAAASIASPSVDLPVLEDSCIAQSAIDSMDDRPLASQWIEFSVQSSMQIPRRPWAVRIYRRGKVSAKLQIFDLQGKMDCNRYEIQQKWEFDLTQEEFDALAASIIKAGVPTPDNFFDDDSVELTLHGTAIALRIHQYGTTLTRQLIHTGKMGGVVSEIFHKIVSERLPDEEVPPENWAVRRDQE